MQVLPHAARLCSAAKLGLAASALLAIAWPAQAQLTLTPAGMADNFTLSTFASGFPDGGTTVGPLGMAFVGGKVLVSDYPGNVRVFATDTDGQTAASAPIAQNYGGANAVGMAQVGGKIYMTQQSANTLVQINNDGTFNQVIATGLPGATGIVADSFTGNVYVSAVNNSTIYTINPVTKTATPFKNIEADGLSLSSDGSVLYGANGNGHIYGFDTTTAAQIYDSGFIPDGVDGTAIGTGALAGNLFVNTNKGTIYEVNLGTNAQTLIANGGTRGDFVSVDPTNGTLLLTQTDSIVRLSAPSGGGFGGGNGTVPEPSTVASFALGALGLAGLLLRARRRTSVSDSAV
jgi:hypothetical protein